MNLHKLVKQAQAPIPTIYGEYNVIAYASDSQEQMPHLALINPKTDLNSIVNVRIHSECMTGDVFGSFRCDCGEQLDRSMKYISLNNGIIIYLRQEGRGIGLINKLHAYVKQDEGLDTADANKSLGFGYDDRVYKDAATILSDLKVNNINLITNNPLKMEGIEKNGIRIHQRIPIEIDARKENHGYLTTKKTRFGHNLFNV